jgi:dTDP-4-dehydrorhamnose reductase
MKILVFGGSGMLGHKLWQVLARDHDTHVTLRHGFPRYAPLRLFHAEHTITNVSAQDFDTVVRAFASARPEVVVNCIGIIKQQSAAKDPHQSIAINSLFPHQLAGLCRATGTRLVHISTDCVFSGRKGNYKEADLPDADDIYGRSKLLGEATGPGCLTIRTSIIGRELESAYGLIDWFLSQEGKTVRGYQKAIFSGFTTLALARTIGNIIEKHPHLEGLYHVSATPVSKFELLDLVREIYGCKIQIEPESTFSCDRSLNSERFRTITGFQPPSWPEMISEMFQDPTPYQDIRKNNAHR